MENPCIRWISEKILSVQGGQPIISIRWVVEEADRSGMLDSQTAGIKHAIFNFLISEASADIIEGFSLPL